MAVAPRFTAYYRVSTDKQGKSGLGLDAQRAAVARQIAIQGGVLVSAFEEVESGKRNDRPALARALASCRANRSILIIAKLDRLARNARFLLSIVEGTGEAGVLFCDLPTLPVGPIGKFMLTQMAAVAELEAGLISQRTKAALAMAKARGKRLGNPKLPAGNHAMAKHAAACSRQQSDQRHSDLAPVIAEIRSAGVTTILGITKALTARGIPTLSGRGRWSSGTVHGVLARIARTA